MLIDLERNDLGPRLRGRARVEVDEFMIIESYAHVHHIVSNVRGRLRADVTPGERIARGVSGRHDHRLPESPLHGDHRRARRRGRGAYTGSLGYLEPRRRHGFQHPDPHDDGARTAHRLRAGAGIVADSIPERELEETRAKARGLLAVFEAPRPV